jgi:lipoprotein NlpI
LDKAIAINANLTEAFCYRGDAYSDKGEYDRALADYNAALNIDPNETHALNNRGIAYFDKGEYDQAE